ncbi:bacterial nucleoid DNA-binding protein [Paenibacillus sp. IHB B 3415]|uniref:Cthe_2314 family HEPN domain-containing protein n=1 Tax=Paenibacillus sp. IHB B 3415 TaxID=867080 RepID=UPI0005738091|nr:Cthe_2314 family HEPN domain-containing protein [Paenibacillus sp. IHB B 3415]KHL92636.1 bacterial nucleoid DNA-binding protein [Paenibacillus sp. IHB B 3415]
MLRTLLGEPPRENSGVLAEAMDNMAKVASMLRKEMNAHEDRDHEYRKLEIWTRGLISSLDELEQSWFAAAFYRKSVVAGYMDDMSPMEQGEYARYVYFYKDGFIRVFSLLDKLGTVLNSLYDLNTGKVKAHFSYFTVLRQFQLLHAHNPLANELEKIRNSYREPVENLRKRRNAEIHYMNAEMTDDLWQRHQGLHDKIQLEDLDSHLEDLKQSLEMVCKSLSAAFRYSNEQWHKNKAASSQRSEHGQP